MKSVAWSAIMAPESKEEGCKIKGEHTPSHLPGAAGTQTAPEERPKRGQVQHGIADPDKKARTGSEQEPVRNTPPAGDWNDVA
jgi:hypothetical protein